MTKTKKSFFEKLTGIKKVENEGQEEIINFQEESSSETSFLEEPNEPMEKPMERNYEERSPQQDFYNESPQSMNNQEQPPQSEPTPITNKQGPETETSDAEGQLTIDVYQTDDDVVIKSTIAGVKPEDLDVNINNDMVTVRGERKQDEEIDPENYYYQECYWGPFSRSVILPVEIIPDKAEAAMKNGILTLRMPKADTTKTRKIQVRGY